MCFQIKQSKTTPNVVGDYLRNPDSNICKILDEISKLALENLKNL